MSREISLFSFLFFRNLANFNKNEIIDIEGSFLRYIEQAFYKKEEIKGDILTAWIKWFKLYKNKLSKEDFSDEERKSFIIVTHDPNIANSTHRIMNMQDGIITKDQNMMNMEDRIITKKDKSKEK